MKRVISIILAVILIFSIGTIAVSAASSKLITLSAKNTVITVSDENNIQVAYAAKVLKQYLNKILGADISVVSQAPQGMNVITVSADSDKSENGSYTINFQKNAVLIQGAGTRGPVYGVYGFLEKYCDCRWYTKDMKLVPQKDAVVLSVGEKYDYTPYFEVTDTDFISPHDWEYSLAHGLSGSRYRSLPEEQGGNVDYISDSCHTFGNQFCSRDKYFEDHPEYFALRKGKRTSKQLCLTNPDVLRIVTDEVLELLKKKHDPSQNLQIVSLTQDDNSEYCTCEKCAALDKANGSQSGTMITFVNEVARAVKEAGYDNVAIDTFAYTYSRKAPTNVVPDDNVIVRLCSIECCFGHTLDDPTCKENVKFMEDLQAWKKICSNIHIWNYTGNYCYSVCIFPDFHVLQKNMQLFYENNVRGIYMEGYYYMDRCDGEFGELRSYLDSKLMQDPYMDYDAVMNDFLEHFYGAGWQNIREFIDIVCLHGADKYTTTNISIDPEDTLPGITSKEIKRCDELWQAAKENATPEQLDRIERSEISWRFWKECNYKSEFSLLRSPLKRMNARLTLYNDIKDKDIKKIGGQVQRDLTENMAMVLLRRATRWCLRYEDIIWETLEPLGTWLCNIIK